MTRSPDHTHTTNPAALRNAWALADRDNEREAWERLYDAVHPRPATDGGV